MSLELLVVFILGVKFIGLFINSIVKIEWCDYFMLSFKIWLFLGIKFLIGIVNDVFKWFDSKIYKEVKVLRDGKLFIYIMLILDIIFFLWWVIFLLLYCNIILLNDVYWNSLFKFVIFYFKFYGWYIWVY